MRPAVAQTVLSSLAAVPQVTLAGLGQAPAAPEISEGTTGQTCITVPEPVVTLDTRSKYIQSGAKDTVDGFARRERDLQMKPVRRFLQIVGGQAFSGKPELENCAAEDLTRWASAGALTEMKSDDAHLSRSRFMAEISLTIDHLDRNGAFSEEQRAVIGNWLIGVAQTTVHFFRFEAGPKSRRNNHRYWAALAVGAAGYFGRDRGLVEWSHESARIGLCQVDANGHLSLEISRGSQARNYHVYALRPLGGLAAISAEKGDDLTSMCDGALARLAKTTLAAVEDPGSIAALAGATQARLVKESDFVAPLRLSEGSTLSRALQRLLDPGQDTAKAELVPALATTKG
ncbi:alginate lyase family protein [Roseibium sp. M-1]